MRVSTQTLASGKTLCGFARPSGSKTARRRRHREQVVGREQQRHLRDLLDADAVLAGDAAAERDARLEDLAAGGEDALDLVRVALVEEDDRVDVAVAGVEDVADAQAVALGGRRDRPQDVGDARARHDAVLRAVVRGEAPDGAEGALARLPQRGALGLVARAADLARAVRPAELRDARGLGVEPGRGPVELDQQHRAGVGRQADVEGRLDRAEDQAVHHLERRGHDAGGDDRRDRLARRVDRLEDGEQRAMGLRVADEPQRRAGHDAERALGPDDQPGEVVARPILDRAAELDDVPRRQHQLDAEDVVGRDAVLERVRAARVLGDVAADRARRLARGIGRVVEPVASDGVGHPQVHDARLRDEAPVADVDRLDADQAARADHDRRADRQRAAGEAGAGAARHERDPLLGEHAHHRRDLGRGARQHDELGRGALEGVAVALVDDEALGTIDDAVVADDRAQATGERYPAAVRRRRPANGDSVTV